MIHFILLLPSPCLLWAFTDSRICYRVFLGNNSSLFTVSAGGTIASHSLNSWFFFLSVCLCFSISSLPSCLHFQSTWIFKLLWRQTLVFGTSVMEPHQPRATQGLPSILTHGMKGRKRSNPKFKHLQAESPEYETGLSPRRVVIDFDKTRMVF